MTRYWILRLLAAALVVALATLPTMPFDFVGEGWGERMIQLKGRDSWMPIGLLFLVFLFGITHWFVARAPKNNPNIAIRRLMLSSMLRLAGASVFLLIQLYSNFRAIPSQKPHVWPVLVYAIFFVSLLAFELFQKGANLRPDSDGK
jgi:hypothetical protein